jgi:hypothetical protein
VSAAELGHAKDEVELLAAQREIKRAHLRAAEAAAAFSKTQLDRFQRVAGVRESELSSLQAAAAGAAAQLDIRKAELIEHEVRMAQAKRRLDRLEALARPAASPVVRPPVAAKPKADTPAIPPGVFDMGVIDFGVVSPGQVLKMALAPSFENQADHPYSYLEASIPDATVGRMRVKVVEANLQRRAVGPRERVVIALSADPPTNEPRFVYEGQLVVTGVGPDGSRKMLAVGEVRVTGREATDPRALDDRVHALTVVVQSMRKERETMLKQIEQLQAELTALRAKK